MTTNVRRYAAKEPHPNRFLGTGDQGNCSPSLAISNAHNLAGDDTCGFDGVTDLEGTDPMLNSLAWAGGPTPSQVPMAASPALDAGSASFCISVDQRDWARPVDGDAVAGAECDLGAVELHPGAEDLIFARDFEWPNPLDRWSSTSS